MEKTKDARIKKEHSRLKNLFSHLNEHQLSTLDGLLQRLSFMRIALEDMEEEIKQHGVTDDGKERAAARTYNAMIKNYSSVMKQVISAYPLPAEEKKKDALLEFVAKRA